MSFDAQTLIAVLTVGLITGLITALLTQSQRFDFAASVAADTETDRPPKAGVSSLPPALLPGSPAHSLVTRFLALPVSQPVV
jgi:hypothetical protein